MQGILSTSPVYAMGGPSEFLKRSKMSIEKCRWHWPLGTIDSVP